jgi:hypothetical protein
MGLVFAVIGAGIGLADRRMQRTGERVTGIVAKYIPEIDLYQVVLKFKTIDGREILAPIPIKSNPPIARLGERVPVIYDPANPQHATIDSWAGRALSLAVTLLVIGLAVFAWGVYLFAAWAA